MTIAPTTMMDAVVLGGDGRVVLGARPVPLVREPGEVLLSVRATGICGTDRGIALGEFPALPGVVLGHETVGEVVAGGTRAGGLRPGHRVVVNPTFYCGLCRRCRRGLPEHCAGKDGREIGIDRDGTMAGFAAVDERFVHRIPDDMPYRRAVLIEPLACVLANLAAAAPRPDDLVLVAGAGPIGVLAALVLAARGVRTGVVERDPERVRLAEQALPDTVRVLHSPDGRLTGAGGAGLPRPDVVVDTTGVLLEEAARLVEPGGVVVVMGERQRARATLECRPLATRGVRLVGAGPYPPHLFGVAVELAGRLPLECVVTHELPLSRAGDALALLGVPAAGQCPGGYRAGKVLLVPDGWAGSW